MKWEDFEVGDYVIYTENNRGMIGLCYYKQKHMAEFRPLLCFGGWKWSYHYFSTTPDTLIGVGSYSLANFTKSKLWKVLNE